MLYKNVFASNIYPSLHVDCAPSQLLHTQSYILWSLFLIFTVTGPEIMSAHESFQSNLLQYKNETMSLEMQRRRLDMIHNL